MCGRLTFNITSEALAKMFSLNDVPQIEARYNIAPSQTIAAVRHVEDRNKLDFLKWGFIPKFSKDNTRTHTNVRSETVHEKPVFAHAIKYKRCIIPASGFYEWLQKDNHKQPYYIRLSNSAGFGLAGLWEQWSTEDGTEYETCCILTTDANEVVKPIHDRMPVILRPDDYNLWLNKNMHAPHELLRLFQPYPAELMIAHPVSNLVNNTRFDGASCILQM